MLEKKLLEEFHGKRGASIKWTKPRDFLKMAKMGIFVPFADAFEYKGNGILLIGHCNSGKTAISGRFVRYNNRCSKRLAEDATTNWFDGEKTFVYQTRRVTSIDLEPILKNGDKYPILAIFHLEEELMDNRRDIREGNLEQALLQMFSYRDFNRQKVSKRAFEASYEAYRRIPVLVLPYYKTSNMRYSKLKEAVISLKTNT